MALPPQSKNLIPPLLACLPAAFVSSHAPPALLQLVSPILRQRIKLLSDSASSPSSSSWLPLLCWDADEASRVETVVRASDFEPHPVSGELEVGEVKAPKFLRLDQETLQSCIALPDLGLQCIYVWCPSDADKGDTLDWHLSELRTLEEQPDRTHRNWCLTMEGAEQSFTVSDHEHPDRHLAPHSGQGRDTLGLRVQDGFEDDDDYWARYDSTPVRTPAVKRSPAFEISNSTLSGIGQSTRDEYLERYAEVQPEMDSDDPSVDRSNLGESSLNGHVVIDTQPPAGRIDAHKNIQTTSNNYPDTNIVHTGPSTSSSCLVAQLESSARNQNGVDLASIAVQQHISTTMKSLYRLAKGAGITRKEFERLISTELEVLGMLDVDE